MEKKFVNHEAGSKIEKSNLVEVDQIKIEVGNEQKDIINQENFKPSESQDSSELTQGLAALGSPSNQTETAPEVVVKEVEAVMAEGLVSVYQQLTPEKKQEFKVKGEVVAKKIAIMTMRFKIKFKEVFSLISDWLKIIPGINRFFLEQEAKIKADRIIEIHDQRMGLKDK